MRFGAIRGRLGRLGGVLRRRWRTTATVAMALCLVAGAAVGWAAHQWREGPVLAFADDEPVVQSAADAKNPDDESRWAPGADWAARGDLTGDKDLLRAAVRAVAVHHGKVRRKADSGGFDAQRRSNVLTPPSARLLYAGHAGPDRAPTVLLLVQNSYGESGSSRLLLARYRDRDGKDDYDTRPYRAPSGGAPPDRAADALPVVLDWGREDGRLNPLQRSPRTRTTRLALPTTLFGLEAAGLDGKDYTWRKLKVSGGVTEPVKPYDPAFRSTREVHRELSDCPTTGLLLRGKLATPDGYRRVHYVLRSSDFVPVSVSYEPKVPSGRAKVRDETEDKDAAEMFDGPHIRTLARQLMCRGAERLQGDPDPLATQVRWERLWQGKLPGRRARHEIVRVREAPGSVRRVLLNTDDPRRFEPVYRDESPEDSELCLAWDGAAVVSGSAGSKTRAERITLRHKGSGERHTAKGRVLTARLGKPDDARAYTAEIRYTDGRTSTLDCNSVPYEDIR
ncbi:hypothetical protein [Streptomyces boncukensis]|uniref:Uncharacterized protein n=1 Tax=Streptomyces boncukensis TaxID=2711219 RepID=A0A6G4X0V6_9ACTN|nr:hypothetical protein [Streptomyces boncukensis]NGO71018.1 hypothetical protein [Streptomyces boncukensis]